MGQIPVICPIIPISSTRCRRRVDALFNQRNVRNATRRRRFTAVTASYDPHLPVSANPVTPKVIQTNLSSEPPKHDTIDELAERLTFIHLETGMFSDKSNFQRR